MSTYGYTANDDTYAINETEADVVRLIYRLYVVDDLSWAQIKRALMNKGVDPPRRRRHRRLWDYTYVKAILTDATYKGTAAHPQIIDDNTWERARRKVANNFQHAPYPDDVRLKVIERWRNEPDVTPKELIDAAGCCVPTFYNWIRQAGLPTRRAARQQRLKLES